MGLGTLAFLAGQALANVNGPPPPPPYVDAETGEIDLDSLPGSMLVVDQNGDPVGYVDRIAAGWVFGAGDASQVPVKSDDGQPAGFLRREGEGPGAPFRFVSEEDGR